MIMQATGSGSVRAALRGTVTEARRADREMSASARRATQERTRMQRQAMGESRRLIREGQREEERARRDSLRSSMAASREERRSRMAEERRLQGELRSARRARGEARSAIPGMVAGGLIGAGTAVMGRVEGMGAALGVPSRDELVRSFIEAQQNFIRTSEAAGIGGERREEILGTVGSVARSTNTDPTQLLAMLDVAQNRFSDLEFFAQNMEAIAQAAQAGGGDVSDWAAAAGEFRRQFGVASEDVPGMFGAMIAAMDAGSIEAGDIASEFTGVMSAFVAARGEEGRGTGGAREFLAVAEGLGAAGLSSSETATRMQGLLSAFGRAPVRAGIERELGDSEIFDSGGRLAMSFPDLIDRMVERGANSPRALERMGLNRVEARGALQTLIDTRSTGSGANLHDLMNVSSEAGLERIATTNAALMDSTSGRALRVGTDARVNFMENGEGVVALMTELVGPLSEFQTRFPLVNEGLGMLRDAAMGAAVGLMGMTALQAMGGGAAVAGGAATGGAATAAAGGSLGLAALGAGAAIIGAERLGDAANRSASRTGASVGFMDSLDSPEMSAFLTGLREVVAGGGSRAAGRLILSNRDAAAIGAAVREGATEGVRAGTGAGAPPATARTSGEPGRRS